MAKEKSTNQKGDDHEDKFVELRRSQGYLSFKRNRKPYGPYDLWGKFDVFSMNEEGIEFCQVKTSRSKDTQGAKKKIQQWLMKNKDKIPKNATFVVAVYNEDEEQFYTTGVWD